MWNFISTVVVKAFKSKTLIVAYLTLIASTLQLWSGAELIQQYPQAIAVIGAILGVVNIVLRYATTLPLGDK